ncbi:MAG: acylneuraminate cytidylyltransferase family protein [Chitinophagaceae bacterium]|jgi:N-acylneuraminate cytidylyltransferase|nr:acylneuraminate cytidylyltransferase family protein [Chitinophagaceae bacterium]OQY95705.1 MAG: CMP-N-acetylneuraminic acid synthetase [Sphingobacteriales bacterium UTBCD1]
MNYLFVIPARGGSKGLPGKNIKLLNDKPLIIYSLEFARLFTSDDNICITTDSDEIADCVKQYGYTVPFKRPTELATDGAGMHEVILHALMYYEQSGKKFDAVILLQPTSPLREKRHLDEALELFNKEVDMVVSVTESEANPYYNLFELDKNGFLVKSKPGHFITRQECPKVFSYNGALYIINTESLRQEQIHKFNKIKMYLMSADYSIDIDTELDWQILKTIIKNKK